jgi:hypothetical protein
MCGWPEEITGNHIPVVAVVAILLRLNYRASEKHWSRPVFFSLQQSLVVISFSTREGINEIPKSQSILHLSIEKFP